MATVKLLTIEMMPHGCNEVIGLISASCCISKSVISDFVANIKNWSIGGELDSYTQLIENSSEVVCERIKNKADQIGAKAVIGIRFSTTQVTEGAVELIIYGTAVR